MSDYQHNTTDWDRDQVRRQTGERGRSSSSGGSGSNRRRRKRGNPVLNVVLYLVCVVVVSALLAGVGWLLANDLCALNKEYKEVTIEVTKDDSVSSVAQKLKDEGLIEYKWFFRLFAWISDADQKIGEGTYELNTNMDYRALILGMASNTGQSLSADTVTVMIPEGYTVQQIINLLAENGVSTVEELTEAAQSHEFTDYEFVDNTNLGSITRLEGYLFPDTYEFYVGENAVSALSRLLSNFARQVDGEVREMVEASDYSLHEIITIASLIEKETDGSDRTTIASVIYNRLNNPSYETGGLLQIDASLVYATGHTVLTEEDMAVDSPYNLYTHTGLPPTPIANPGLASIMAALEPANTDYYYYALGTDGSHHYFTNYTDHQNFVNSSEYGG